MFLLKIKKRYFFSTIILCLSNLLSQSNIALAQLRLGRGIQQGLEGHLLEYQIQQQPLEKMQGISGCSIGFGAGCNKTASLLQKIVTESTGKTYQDILLQAVGGRDNYLSFTSYYPQNVDISSLPLNSFWVNGGDYILDSHRYSGIGDLERIPQSDFRFLVSQFTYAPIVSGKEKLNLQQGLIGLKTAYGRALVEEAHKIPNIEQKIAASGLSKAEINFHLQQFLHGVEALQTGNEQQLNSSLYQLLSNPYTSDPGVLNRPSLGISQNLDRQIGIGLEGDEYIASFATPSLIAPETSETAIFNSADLATSTATVGSNNTPLYFVAGVGGLTLLALLLTDLDGSASSNSDSNTNNSGGGVKPEINPLPPSENPPETEIPVPHDSGVIAIPETNSAVQFLILVALALINKPKFNIRDRRNTISQ